MIENKGRHFGYARVSTEEQNLDSQIAYLQDKGITDDFIYTDKASGTVGVSERQGINDLFKRLDAGDTLHVYKLDRLSRKYDHLQKFVHALQSKRVRLVSRDLPELDTKNEVMNAALLNIMVSMLGVVSDMERVNIKARQADGIKEAKKKGKYKGRVRKYTADSKDAQGRLVYKEISEMLKDYQSIRTIASSCGVGSGTVQRIKKELKESGEIL